MIIINALEIFGTIHNSYDNDIISTELIDIE